MFTDSEIEIICKGSYGGWISAFWESVCDERVHRPMSFDEHKEAFFWLIEKLLKEEKIALEFGAMPKGALFEWGDTSPERRALENSWLWNEPIDQIVAKFREIFPKHVTSEHDYDLAVFWYAQSPYIVWKTSEGTWKGS